MNNKRIISEITNGQIPDSELQHVSLPTGGTSNKVKLTDVAAKDFDAMVKAAYDEDKIKITASQG